jgi:RNA polymerase sigma factor (sigma-70 family)
MSYAGSRNTPEGLVWSVTPLVYRLARAYATRQGRPDLGDDLAHELLQNLLKTARRGTYDPERGKPTTWAHGYVRLQSPRIFAQLVAPVRVPQITACTARGRLARCEEPRNTYEAAAMAAFSPTAHPASLDTLPSRGEVREHAADSDMLARLDEALASLPERDRDILRSYYQLGGGARTTLETIGKRYGIGKERVRQLRNRQLKHLREILMQGDGEK